MVLSFGSSFVGLFQNIFSQWYILLLLIFGVVFAIVEGFVPGFGIFGILGILFEIAGVVTYAILNTNVVEILLLVLFVVIIFLILFLILVNSAKYGVISRSPFVEKKTAVSTNYKEKFDEVLKQLIGKDGLTITECHPVGKIRIGNEQFEVTARSKIIAKGEVVTVVAVEDSKLIIDKRTY